MPEETVLNENVPTVGKPPDLSEAIGKLMAHPEILSMAASVLGQSAPLPTSEEEAPSIDAGDAPASEMLSASRDASPASTLPHLMETLGPMLSKKGGFPGTKSGERIHCCTSLLLSLKPYLSPTRCQTVDRLVEISKLGTLLESFR